MPLRELLTSFQISETDKNDWKGDRQQDATQVYRMLYDSSHIVKAALSFELASKVTCSCGSNPDERLEPQEAYVIVDVYPHRASPSVSLQELLDSTFQESSTEKQCANPFQRESGGDHRRSCQTILRQTSGELAVMVNRADTHTKKLHTCIELGDVTINGMGFQLRTVVHHEGPTPHYGHYTTTALVPGQGWFLFDDNVVSPCSPPSCSTTAVLCFFARTSPDQLSSKSDNTTHFYEDAKAEDASNMETRSAPNLGSNATVNVSKDAPQHERKKKQAYDNDSKPSKKMKQTASQDVEISPETAREISQEVSQAEKEEDTEMTAESDSNSELEPESLLSGFSTSADADRKRQYRQSERGKAARAAQRRDHQIQLEKVQDEIASDLIESCISLQALLSVHAGGNAELLLKVVNHQNAVNQRIQHSLDHPFFEYLASQAPRLSHCLASLARDPSSFLPSAFSDILIPSSDQPSPRPCEDATKMSLHVYLRQVKATAAQHIKWSNRYSRRHPADRHREVPFLASISSLAPDALVSRWYGGVSGKTLGEGRGKQDDQDSKWSRIKNYVAVVGSEHVSYYDFRLEGPEWEVDCATFPASMRPHPLLSAFEETLVASLGPGRLNSDFGGMRPSWVPSAALEKVKVSVHNVTAKLSPSTLEVPRRPSRVPPPNYLANLLTTIRKDKLDEREHWSTDPDGDSDGDISIESLENVAVQGAAAGLTPDGWFEKARVLKDITREDFNFHETGCWFFNKLGGQAGISFRRIVGWARSLDSTITDPDLFVPTLDSLSTSYGSFCDLWSIILKHKGFVIAIIFLIRYLYRVDAPVVVVTSAKLAYLIVHSILPLCVDTTSDAFDSVVREGDSTLIALVKMTLPPWVPKWWDDLPITDWIEFWVAQIIICNITNLEDGIRIFILQIHVGLVKYDPQLAALAHNLAALVELKVEILAALVAAVRPNPDKEFYIQVREKVEEIARETGLTDAIEDARRSYLRLSNVLYGLRNLGSEEKEDERDERNEKALGASKTFQKFNSESLHALHPAKSKRRRKWVDSLIEEHQQLEQSGLGRLSRVPSIINGEVASNQWREWIESAKEGLNLVASARATGRSPTDHITTEEELQKYLATRAELAAAWRLQWTSEKEYWDAVELLADPTRERVSENRRVLHITHELCPRSCIGQSQTRHRCIAIPNIPSATPRVADSQAGHSYRNVKLQNNFVPLKDASISQHRLFFVSQLADLSTSEEGPVDHRLLPEGWVSIHSHIILENSSSYFTNQFSAPESTSPRLLYRATSDSPTESTIPAAAPFWVKDPTTDDFTKAQNWITFQAECALLLSRRATNPLDPVWATDFRWYDERRVSSVISFLASITPPAGPPDEKSNKVKKAKSKTTHVLKLAECSAVDPCSSSYFGKGKCQITHSKDSGHAGGMKNQRTVATFDSFLSLPFPLINRVLIAMWDFEDANDKMHQLWKRVGSPSPLNWVVGGE